MGLSGNCVSKMVRKDTSNGKKTKGIHRLVQGQGGDGGAQGGQDLGRVGNELSSSPESDLGLKEPIDSERARGFFGSRTGQAKSVEELTLHFTRRLAR